MFFSNLFVKNGSIRIEYHQLKQVKKKTLALDKVKNDYDLLNVFFKTITGRDLYKNEFKQGKVYVPEKNEYIRLQMQNSSLILDEVRKTTNTYKDFSLLVLSVDLYNNVKKQDFLTFHASCPKREFGEYETSEQSQIFTIKERKQLKKEDNFNDILNSLFLSGYKKIVEKIKHEQKDEQTFEM